MILGGCSTNAKTPPVGYIVLPSHLTAVCTVHDIAIDVVSDLIQSRSIYKAAFEKCAAQVDAIREHDKRVQQINKGDPN